MQEKINSPFASKWVYQGSLGEPVDQALLPFLDTLNDVQLRAKYPELQRFPNTQNLMQQNQQLPTLPPEMMELMKLFQRQQ